MRPTSCLLLLLAVFAAAGCAFQGDRARTAMCPPGETCSDLTPDGLAFRGAPLSGFAGSNTLALAVGGWATIEVEGSGTRAILDRFAATAEPASAFAVSDIRPPRLTLHALGPATGLLRVSDSVTGELFDRVSISAAPIDHVTLQPELLFVLDPRYNERAPVLLRGTRGQLVVRLQAAGDQVLADERMTVSVPSGDTVRQTAWDLAEVSTTNDHTVLTVQSGASRVDVTVRAVDRADTIELMTPAATSAPITVDATASLCFAALSGADLVTSLEWRFVGSAGVTVRPGDTAGALMPASCIEVDGVTRGPATVEASLGTTSLTVTLDVTNPAPARAALVAPGPRSAPRSLVLGERARSMD